MPIDYVVLVCFTVLTSVAKQIEANQQGQNNTLGWPRGKTVVPCPMVTSLRSSFSTNQWSTSYIMYNCHPVGVCLHEPVQFLCIYSISTHFFPDKYKGQCNLYLWQLKHNHLSLSPSDNWSKVEESPSSSLADITLKRPTTTLDLWPLKSNHFIGQFKWFVARCDEIPCRISLCPWPLTFYHQKSNKFIFEVQVQVWTKLKDVPSSGS